MSQTCCLRHQPHASLAICSFSWIIADLGCSLPESGRKTPGLEMCSYCLFPSHLHLFWWHSEIVPVTRSLAVTVLCSTLCCNQNRRNTGEKKVNQGCLVAVSLRTNLFGVGRSVFYLCPEGQCSSQLINSNIYMAVCPCSSCTTAQSDSVGWQTSPRWVTESLVSIWCHRWCQEAVRLLAHPVLCTCVVLLADLRCAGGGNTTNQSCYKGFLVLQD